MNIGPKVLLLTVASLWACSGRDGADGLDGEDGEDGEDGSRGEDGADGRHGSVVRIDDEPAGEHCRQGGVVVYVGLDDDGDRALDDAEIDATRYVCAGASAGGEGRGNVVGFHAIGAGDRVVLRWQNPVGEAFAGVTIRRTTSGFAASPADGQAVYQGTGSTTTDSGLTPGAAYFYRAFAYDADGNFASGADASAMALPPGHRDPSFNQVGAVFIPAQQAYAGVSGLAIDSEGRATLTGFDHGAAANSSRAVIWGVERDGATDTRFGGAIHQAPSTAAGVLYDALDRLLVSVNGPQLIQLLPDGTADFAFGTGGVADTALAAGPGLLQRDEQGRILVAASVGSNAMVLARLSEQGVLDAGFGTAGSVHVDGLPGAATRNVIPSALAVDGTDALVLGVGIGPNDDFDLAVWRFDANGDPVAGFSDDGVVTIDGFGADNMAIGHAIAVDAEHRIVVGGSINEGANQQAALWRFTSVGALDGDFADGGVFVDRDPAGGAGTDSIQDLVLDDQGRIIAVGVCANAAGGSDAVVWRYLPDGTLDPSFGEGGRVIERGSDGAGSAADGATDVALDPWGRIVVGGQRGPSFSTDVAVWRLVP